MQIHDLGHLMITADDGTTVHVNGLGARLIGALLSSGGRPVPATQLCAWLWPEQDTGRQHQKLQTLMWRTRLFLQTVGHATVVYESGTYRLIVKKNDTVDSDIFAASAQMAAQMLKNGEATGAVEQTALAEQRWRGQFLGTAGDVEWAASRREELDEMHQTLIEVRWQALLSEGSPQAVIEETLGLASHEVLRDQPWELRMRAQLMLRRFSEALSTFSQMREIWAENLGLDPGPEARRLQQMALLSSSEASWPQPGRHTVLRTHRRDHGTHIRRGPVRTRCRRVA